jgi:protein TonB
MQFSHQHPAGGGKFGKFALVAGIHVALAALFIHGLDTKKLALPGLPDDVTVMFKPEPPPPPSPPPEPPQPVQRVAPPELVIPQVEVDVAPPPEPLRAATTTPTPTPVASTPAQAVPEAPAAARPATNAGAIRSAVLADANGCALPAYPPRALRNEETGTTTLALLVGADGRVTSARVERSSGSRDLDQAALHALSLCTFKPALNNGVAEAGWARLAYVWTLD